MWYLCLQILFVPNKRRHPRPRLFFSENKIFSLRDSKFQRSSHRRCSWKTLKIKRKTPVFSVVFISHLGFNISLQLSIYQVIFLNVKNSFSHCFSTFFLFYKLQFCSYKGKFWYIYAIGIKIIKQAAPPFIPTPAYNISLNFPTPLFINSHHPVPFILDLRIWYEGETYINETSRQK